MAVRDWRHLYAIITGSERLGLVSFEARWLYTCLLAHQDDAGMYPWTPVRVREFTATCTWSYDEATTYLAELEHVGLVSRDAEMVVLRRGKELNGVPTTGSKRYLIPRYYPRSNSVSTAVEPSANVGSTGLGSRTPRREEKREEESGVGAVAPQHTPKTKILAPPETKRREHEPINDEFLAKVRARFPMLDIDAELARAQNRRQWDDYKDKRRHFEDWLERSRDHLVPPAVAARNGSRPASAAPIPTIWMPSMGAEHRGEGSSIKVCGLAECKVAACLGLRRKVGVAGESGVSAPEAR